MRFVLSPSNKIPFTRNLKPFSSSTNDFSTGSSRFLNLSAFLLHHYHHSHHYRSFLVSLFVFPHQHFLLHSLHMLFIFVDELMSYLLTICEYIDVQSYTLTIFCMPLLGILYAFLVIDRGKCHRNSALSLFLFWVISILNIFAIKRGSQNNMPFLCWRGRSNMFLWSITWSVYLIDYLSLKLMRYIHCNWYLMNLKLEEEKIKK